MGYRQGRGREPVEPLCLIELRLDDQDPLGFERVDEVRYRILAQPPCAADPFGHRFQLIIRADRLGRARGGRERRHNLRRKQIQQLVPPLELIKDVRVDPVACTRRQVARSVFDRTEVDGGGPEQVFRAHTKRGR